MSSKLRLHIDATLAEISGITPPSSNTTKSVSKKWYLSKIGLKEGLTQFFSTYPELKTDSLFVTTSYGQHVLDKYAGEVPALLVSSGFESWPFIRQPVENRIVSARPRRSQPLLSSDLVFGLSERTLADGTIEKNVEASEIEFLVSKLKFAEVKHVAVGFLHSIANPQNEELVSKALKENGFEVSISSDNAIAKNSNERPNEVARWWRTFIDAYLKSPMTDFLKPLYDFGTENNIKIQLCNGEGSGQLTDSLYSLETLVRGQSKSDVLYLGLHRFAFLQGLPRAEILESSWGPVLVQAPSILELPIQPTQEISMNPYGTLDFTSQRMGLDPGPMILGRSLRMTLLDLFAISHTSLFPTFDGLNKDSTDKIRNAITLLARSSKMSAEEAQKHLLDMFVERTSMMLRLNTSQDITVAGPLANAFVALFEKSRSPLKLRLLDE